MQTVASFCVVARLLSALVTMLVISLSSCSSGPEEDEIGRRQLERVDQRPSFKTIRFDSAPVHGSAGAKKLVTPNPKIPRQVVYCKLATEATQDPFANSANGADSGDLIERWLRISRAIRLDDKRAHLISKIFDEAFLSPLTEVPACGYSGAAVILGANDAPLFAILRMNLDGYYRLANEVNTTPSGYTINLDTEKNAVYVRHAAFRRLLW